MRAQRSRFGARFVAQSFDIALLNLYKQNRVELEEALLYADSLSNLEAKINFG